MREGKERHWRVCEYLFTNVYQAGMGLCNYAACFIHDKTDWHLDQRAEGREGLVMGDAGRKKVLVERRGTPGYGFDEVCTDAEGDLWKIRTDFSQDGASQHENGCEVHMGCERKG